MLVATTNFAPFARREDALLFARAQHAEQRNDFGLVAEAAFQKIARLADVALAGHEMSTSPADDWAMICPVARTAAST